MWFVHHRHTQPAKGRKWLTKNVTFVVLPYNYPKCLQQLDQTVLRSPDQGQRRCPRLARPDQKRKGLTCERQTVILSKYKRTCKATTTS